MSITYVDKIDGIVVVTKDGETIRRTGKYADAVISIAPENYRKVTNIYIEPVSGKLVVIYEE